MTIDERPQPRIEVTVDGPYRVVGPVTVYDATGQPTSVLRSAYLCRCGGSRNKPWCDATHGLKDFVGTETADHGTVADRAARYDGDGVTIVDDRSLCAHYGQCTDRAPQVFRATEEPFVDALADSEEPITEVIRGCPSGALSYAGELGQKPIEEHVNPCVTALPDGPYRVSGAIQVVGALGAPYEARERQTLCRCGQSENKPFCDGSHWYGQFRDPQPADEIINPPSLFEWAGGLPEFEKLAHRFYDDLLNEPDPVLEPVFRGMDPEHPRHVAAWLAEVFGGPATFTERLGGYEHMAHKHRGLSLTEPQRRRWIERMCRTADLVALPDDPDFRANFVSYLEWGTRIAVLNSQPDAAIIEHAPVPKWGWGQTPPFTPQPWEAQNAARDGRERHARDGHL